MGRDERLADTWAVHRQDDTGNSFVVRTGLDRDDAERLAAELESRGHKQLYWVERECRAGLDGDRTSSVP